MLRNHLGPPRNLHYHGTPVNLPRACLNAFKKRAFRRLHFGSNLALQMAWQNWDQNNNDGRKNEAAWHFSNTAPEPLHFSSQGQFSPNAAMLEWPQTYRMPITTASGAFVILPIAGCMSHFDNTFTDEAAWEDQCAWGSMGNAPYDGLGGFLGTEHNSPDLTACDRGIPTESHKNVMSQLTRYFPLPTSHFLVAVSRSQDD